MNKLKKVSYKASYIGAILLAGLTTSTLTQAYEHKGLQWSAGVGANFSQNHYYENGESIIDQPNNGYNFNIDYGYGFNSHLITSITFNTNFYKGNLEGYDTPEPFLMQMNFFGPTIRYYLKGNEPSFFLQAGAGLGYHSITDVSSFKKYATSRHIGEAASLSIGYEVDMYWNIRLNYQHAEILMRTNEDESITSQSLSLTLHFSPRANF